MGISVVRTGLWGILVLAGRSFRHFQNISQESYVYPTECGSVMKGSSELHIFGYLFYKNLKKILVVAIL